MKLGYEVTTHASKEVRMDRMESEKKRVKYHP